MQPQVSQNPQVRTKLSLSNELDIIASLGNSGQVTLGQVVDAIGLRGHAIVSFVLVLPFLQPIPLAGLSTVLGAVIVLLGLMLALNQPPYLPTRIANRPIAHATLLKLSDIGHRLLVKLERYIRPRGLFFFESPMSRVLTASIVVLCGILLALPLPIPLSNTIPAWTIAVVSVALIERDGVLMVLGFVLFLVTLLFFIGLALLPRLGFTGAQEFLKGLGLGL